MSEEKISSFCAAIRSRSEIIWLTHGSRQIVYPHALFRREGSGVLAVTVVYAGSGILAYVSMSEIEEIALTGRTFDPDPRFDPKNRRYRNALCVIECR